MKTLFCHFRETASKKEMEFGDILRLLHKQPVLNILSDQLGHFASVDYAAMRDILGSSSALASTTQQPAASSSSSREKSGPSSSSASAASKRSANAWTEYFDQLEEASASLQDKSLNTYDAFHAIAQLVDVILHSAAAQFTQQTKVSVATPNNNNALAAAASAEYGKHVTEKLRRVKDTVNRLAPLNFRLEVLENLYSLVFVMPQHFNAEQLSMQEDDANDNDDIDIDSGSDSDDDDDDDDEDDDEEDEQGEDVDGSEDDDVYVNDNNKIHGSLAKRTHQLDVGSLKSSSMTSNFSSALATAAAAAAAAKTQSRRRRRRPPTTNMAKQQQQQQRKGERSHEQPSRRGGGKCASFVVGELLCRDMLILLRSMLNFAQTETASSSTSSSSSSSFRYQQQQQQQQHASSLASTQVRMRMRRLEQLVDESIYRFQLAKSDAVKMEYGHISLVTDNNNNKGGDEQESDEAESQVVYEVMKRRRLSFNSLDTSATSPPPPPPQQLDPFRLRKYKNVRKQLDQVCTLRSKRTPVSIVTKLLADVDSLASMLLVERKYEAAAQLVNMYAAPLPGGAGAGGGGVDKARSGSFEYRQIAFRLKYQQTLANMSKLDNNSSNRSNVIKLADELLDLIDPQQPVQQLIVLADLVLSSSSSDTTKTALLVEYALERVGTLLANTQRRTLENADATTTTSTSSTPSSFIFGNLRKMAAKFAAIAAALVDDDENAKNATGGVRHGLKRLGAQLSKLDADFIDKLNAFFASALALCTYKKSGSSDDSSWLEDAFGLNGVSFALVDHVGTELPSLADNCAQRALELLKSHEAYAKRCGELDSLVGRFEQVHETLIYTDVMSKLAEAMRVVFASAADADENTATTNTSNDLIEVLFYKRQRQQQQQQQQQRRALGVVSWSQLANKRPSLASSIGSHSTTTTTQQQQQQQQQQQEQMSIVFNASNDLASPIDNTSGNYYVFNSQILAAEAMARSPNYNNNNHHQSHNNSNNNNGANNHHVDYLHIYYEYCKSWHDIFFQTSHFSDCLFYLESSYRIVAQSVFSLLAYSPDYLLSILLFELSAKPSLVEPLAAKLAIDLLDVVVKSSCPPLVLVSAPPPPTPTPTTSTPSPAAVGEHANIAAFYTLLNKPKRSTPRQTTQTDDASASSGRADLLVQDILSKLLKFLLLYDAKNNTKR